MVVRKLYHTLKMADDDASGFRNMELLSKCDVKGCHDLLHHIVDGICHRNKPTFDQYSKMWSLQEWWAMNEALTDLLKQSVQESWTKDQLLQHLTGLSEDYQSLIYDVVSSRTPDIRTQLLHDSHAISQASMSDFDWKLKFVMSSDKIASVQEQLLSLDLDVQTKEGRKSVPMELTKTQLDQLIASLEAANKAMIQLKS